MDTTLLIVRPGVVVTWINVLFGAGFGLVVMGLGLLIRRGPSPTKRNRTKRRKRAAFSRT